MYNYSMQHKTTAFFSKYSIYSYTKGQVIIWEDTAPEHIIYLVSGNVGQYSISKSGKKVCLNIYKNPAFFPMSIALLDQENIYSFEALTDVRCRLAPPVDVLEFLNKNPEVSLDLLTRLCSGMDFLLRRVTELTLGTARSQIALELLVCAYRFGEHRGNGTYLLNIKTTELASRTGIARETISRELKKMHNENLIQKNGQKILVRDTHTLKQNLSD